jgi:hypothetical protein
MQPVRPMCRSRLNTTSNVMRPNPNYRFPVIAALALLLLVGPLLAQVFLPARRVVPFPSGEPPTCAETECGTPPVTDGLVQWLCPNMLATCLGYTNLSLISTIPDISPKQTNGVWLTNLFGASNVETGALHTVGGLNGKAYIQLGTPSGAAKRTPYANSNAWWTGVTAAQMFIVVDLNRQSATDMSLIQLSTVGVSPDAMWSPNSYGAGDNRPRLKFASSVPKMISNDPIFKTASPTYLRLCIWSAANDWGVRSNNVVIFSTNVNTVAWPGTAGEGLVGAYGAGGYPLYAAFYELLIYTNKLSDTDTTNIDNWLSAKYGF